MNFLTPTIMAGEDWRGLEIALCRLLAHCGWQGVQDIARSGDKGADILAVRQNASLGHSQTYLVQVKAVTSGNYVTKAAIQQAVEAQGHYRSEIIIVATNGDFLQSAHKRAEELRKHGFDVRLWNGAFLRALLEKSPSFSSNRRSLRHYQSDIRDIVVDRIKSGNKRSLFVVATGLGKTVIASSVAQAAFEYGLKRILVLCHATDLAFQLQREFWVQMSKSVSTRVFLDGEPPVPIEGVNFGLYQSFYNNLGGISPDSFDLVIVDEAHHALANAFALSINYLTPKHLVGMTATPWRGDGESIETIFGEPIAKISLLDGMKWGFLASVDYRLMCDNIDWEEVPKLSKSSLSIRDLNKRLFLPQRDEAVIDQLCQTASELDAPRIAIFSPSINHAEEFARKLSARGISCANASTSDRTKRRSILMDFAAGRLQAISAVDVLNEGIDVPDVNMIVFLRATHSRRIFIQQLGRGLRLAHGKDKVIVLDFVTDVRRLAAVINFDREVKKEVEHGSVERLWLNRDAVSFSSDRAQKFIEAWLDDVASLEDTDESQHLTFPDVA